MNRIKIAVYHDDFFSFGGEQRVVSNIINHLCDFYDITLITAVHKPAFLPFEIDKRINIVCAQKTRQRSAIEIKLKKCIRRINSITGIMNNRRLYKALYKCFEDQDYFKRIIEIITANKTDVFIGVSNRACPLLYKIAKTTNIKTVAWMHNSFEAYFNTKFLYCWQQDFLYKVILSEISECVVLNEDISQKYKSHLGVNCRVIYNPRSFVSDEKAKLRNKLFVASGRMVYAKGFDYLLESFRVFCEKNSEWNLLLLGDGLLREKLKETVEEYGLQNRVIFTGLVNNVKEYMLGSSVFLLTSRWEGFPMVITEALELGLPVIAFDIPAMLPLITDGQEGIIVKAYNTQKYAEAMLRLAENEKLRKEMAQNGITKAKTFTVETIIEQWCELIEELHP